MNHSIDTQTSSDIIERKETNPASVQTHEKECIERGVITEVIQSSVEIQTKYSWSEKTLLEIGVQTLRKELKDSDTTMDKCAE